MSSYIEIEPGQYVLAFADEYFTPGKTLAQNLEFLAHWSGGWGRVEAPHILPIRLVHKVMPKTYLATDLSGGGERLMRMDRKAVVIAGRTVLQLVELRSKLLSIGNIADREISEATARRMAPFVQRTLSRAEAEIRRTLPHVFPKGAS